jgi:hypothetical protein
MKVLPRSPAQIPRGTIQFSGLISRRCGDSATNSTTQPLSNSTTERLFAFTHAHTQVGMFVACAACVCGGSDWHALVGSRDGDDRAEALDEVHHMGKAAGGCLLEPALLPIKRGRDSEPSNVLAV